MKLKKIWYTNMNKEVVKEGCPKKKEILEKKKIWQGHYTSVTTAEERAKTNGDRRGRSIFQS